MRCYPVVLLVSNYRNAYNYRGSLNRILSNAAVINLNVIFFLPSDDDDDDNDDDEDDSSPRTDQD